METQNAGQVLEIKAPAKINLFLEILEKRQDGYHNINSIMVPIDLHDYLTFERTSEQIELVCEGADISGGEDNLVLQAARLLQETFNVHIGANISLRKNIPVGAGLGGGSSDAAVTLIALNHLWELGLKSIQLLSLADRIGADVPFFIQAVPAYVSGRGEDVTPLQNNLGQLLFVLVVPDFGVSTKDVYGKLQVPRPEEHRKASGIIEGFIKGEWEHVTGNIYNRLQEAAFVTEPRLKEFYEELSEACNSRITMSGSGSAFFICCKSDKECKDVLKSLEGIDIAQLIKVTSLTNENIKLQVGDNEN
jgi:4-diphosphocytidyl-2-C-methyl-D-erythritol kinase